MRIKILLLGDNPSSLVADTQLLRERGMLVITSFNLDNINEMIAELKPDIIFFDAYKSNNKITEVYNDVVNGIRYSNIPVVFTLSEDDVYLVNRKRTESKNTRSLIADNMIDAIKLALDSSRSAHAKTKKPHILAGNNHLGRNPGSQLPLPF